jgi:hypothetical protein
MLPERDLRHLTTQVAASVQGQQGASLCPPAWASAQGQQGADSCPPAWAPSASIAAARPAHPTTLPTDPVTTGSATTSLTDTAFGAAFDDNDDDDDDDDQPDQMLMSPVVPQHMAAHAVQAGRAATGVSLRAAIDDAADEAGVQGMDISPLVLFGGGGGGGGGGMLGDALGFGGEQLGAGFEYTTPLTAELQAAMGAPRTAASAGDDAEEEEPRRQLNYDVLTVTPM